MRGFARKNDSLEKKRRQNAKRENKRNETFLLLFFKYKIGHLIEVTKNVKFFGHSFIPRVPPQKNETSEKRERSLVPFRDN
jgi:hypothetical protein